MQGLNLDQVGTEVFRAQFEQEFWAGIQERPAIAEAVQRDPGAENRNADYDAGWTNVLLNMMVAWAASEGWRIDDQDIRMKARPEAFHLPPKGANRHDKEYQTDISMYENDGGEDGETWAEWLHHPNRREYHGVLVALESEWGGVRSTSVEEALDEMMADFYKVLDSRGVLGIFIHWLPSEVANRELVQAILRQSHSDHRNPPTTVCVGFDQETWADVLVNPPTFTWLGL